MAYRVDQAKVTYCSKEVIAPIEDPKVIRRILEHLGLWLANAQPDIRNHFIFLFIFA